MPKTPLLSKHQIEAIIESSFDGIYITDGQANTLMVNSAYENMTGIRREEVIGRNMRDLVNEGFIDQSVTLKVIETGERATIRQKLRSGKEILVTGNPIFDDQGNFDGSSDWPTNRTGHRHFGQFINRIWLCSHR